MKLLYLIVLASVLSGSWQLDSYYYPSASKQFFYNYYPSFNPVGHYNHPTQNSDDYDYTSNKETYPFVPYSSDYVEELIQQRNLALFFLLQAKGIIGQNEPSTNEGNENVEGRTVGGIKKLATAKAESRGAGLLLPALLLGGGLYGSTTTSYVFTTSTMTTTSVISCIPTGSFTAGASTSTCRKRRDLAVVRDLLAALPGDEDQQQQISPSKILGVEPTPVADLIHRSNREVEELVSSLSTGKSEDIVEPKRQKRVFGLGLGRLVYNTLLAKTITSTVTTYSFTTTQSKKTVNIGSSLLCLPLSYSVC